MRNWSDPCKVEGSTSSLMQSSSTLAELVDVPTSAAGVAAAAAAAASAGATAGAAAAAASGSGVPSATRVRTKLRRSSFTACRSGASPPATAARAFMVAIESSDGPPGHAWHFCFREVFNAEPHWLGQRSSNGALARAAPAAVFFSSSRATCEQHRVRVRR